MGTMWVVTYRVLAEVAGVGRCWLEGDDIVEDETPWGALSKVALQLRTQYAGEPVENVEMSVEPLEEGEYRTWPKQLTQ